MKALPIALVAAALLVPATASAKAGGSGRPCSTLLSSASAPLSGGPCPGVRPGAWVETPIGFCTLNFAFRGRKKARYIATAGHCALDEEQGEAEQVWKRGKGPVAKDVDGNPIGRFAYAVLEGEKDISFIRLRRGIKPNPSMCHYGGPTGIDQDRSAGAQTLHLYGNGALAGDLAPARDLLALSLTNADHVFATGIATPGDSGGPVTSRDGRAVGVLVSGGVLIGGLGTSGVDAGTIGITRLGPQLARAEFKMRERLRLLTAAVR
jgi:hypothetical protein